jgi:hypothetical protein
MSDILHFLTSKFWTINGRSDYRSDEKNISGVSSNVAQQDKWQDK